MSLHAIITGDIVSSRKINPATRERLYKDIDSFLKSMKKQWIKGYEMYRGDSIQCEAVSLAASLRAALIIKTYVMSYMPPALRKKLSTAQNKGRQLRGYMNVAFDIRLAIGMGQVDFINRNSIAGSDGTAFQLSGETLDSLKDESQRLSLKTQDHSTNRELEAIIALLDALTQKWTQNQAEFVLHKLQKKKDEEIATGFRITLSAVNQRKKNAQWFAIEKAIEYFETKFAA